MRKSKDIHQRIAWHKKQRKLQNFTETMWSFCPENGSHSPQEEGRGGKHSPLSLHHLQEQQQLSAGSYQVSIRLHETRVALHSCSGATTQHRSGRHSGHPSLLAPFQRLHLNPPDSPILIPAIPSQPLLSSHTSQKTLHNLSYLSCPTHSICYPTPWLAGSSPHHSPSLGERSLSLASRCSKLLALLNSLCCPPWTCCAPQG